MKGRSASKIKLTSYDELLGGAEVTNDIRLVPIGELHSFINHPFHVNDDEAMEELVESVKQEGILTALLVRPMKKGDMRLLPVTEENMLHSWPVWNRCRSLSERWIRTQLSVRW